MKNELYQEVLEVTLSAGQVTDNETVHLPDGECTRVVAMVIKGEATENVNISLMDSSGNDIVKPHTYKLWEQRIGGSYFDSLKPVDFNCGRNVKAVLTAPDALAGDITFQFLFYIKTP